MIRLYFDAPLMSFGGPAVDQVGNTFQFPPKSMLTGLIGAALGLDRSEHTRLQQVQEGFSYGVREDRAGEVIEDFQTADLQTPWMTETWADGEYLTGNEVRETEKPREILHKEYIADAVYTIILAPTGLSEERLLRAFRQPKWPLYVGRKGCGAGPLRPAIIASDSLQEALRSADLHPAAEMKHRHRVWTEGGDQRSIYGLRDWESRIHAGKQWIKEDTVDIPPS